MPPSRRILSDAEAYAVTAYLLHFNGIIGADDVMDATSLQRKDAESRRVQFGESAQTLIVSPSCHPRFDSALCDVTA
jgi:hypothetical protein